MGMADHAWHLRTVVDDAGIEDAFSEWDENAPIAQFAEGSQPHPLATTVFDPVTTRALAEQTRRYVPRSLEEALQALADGIIGLASPASS